MELWQPGLCGSVAAIDADDCAGLVDALRNATTHSRFSDEAYGPVTDAIGRLLDANQSAGPIDSGVTPDDVLLLVADLWQIDPSGDWQPQAERLLDLVVDGLAHQNKGGKSAPAKTPRP